MRAGRSIIPLPFLFAMLMALPLVVLLFMMRAPAKLPTAPQPRLLERLREQGFLEYGEQHDAAADGETDIESARACTRCFHPLQAAVMHVNPLATKQLPSPLFSVNCYANGMQIVLLHPANSSNSCH
jgi:hypothetical protein